MTFTFSIIGFLSVHDVWGVEELLSFLKGLYSFLPIFSIYCGFVVNTWVFID